MAVKADDDLVDVPKLTAWLRHELPADGEATVTRLGAETGIGNALFLVHWGGRSMVLRRPPAERITASAGDTDRERRLLQALVGTGVRHPEYIAWCADPGVIGAPFLLMEQVDGFTPVAELPAHLDNAGSRNLLGLEATDALAELSLVDWRAAGLEGFGKPEGFLDRQVGRWLWQLDSYASRELPGLTELASWLRAHTPRTQATGILHGDYSLFNVMCAHDAPLRVNAIVDWDTATIGDPIMDFGHLTARWDEPGEKTTLGSVDFADRTGLTKRADMAERYAGRTGWDLSALPYYQAVSLFKLGVIMEGHYAKGVRDGSEAALLHAETGPGLILDALACARGERA
ncbi:MAG TPA: phosphotransferase family protein [Mycobacteriales bacterium]|nr:phosphotransferase family protein [Mycobacteriales bacterium]